jgi:hypothetical protein
MKNVFLRSLLALAIIIQLTSCKTQMIVSNGGYSDISLVRESKDYSIKRLAEVSSDNAAIIGIPRNKSANKTRGMVFRFNGYNVSDIKGVFPILSMIGLSVTTGYIINELVGYRSETVPGYSFEEPTDEYKLGFGTSGYVVPLIVGSILAIPVSGAINNLVWHNSAFKRAAFSTNNKLLQDNPGIDVFLNPKYEIQRHNGIWKQTATIKLKAMGATITEN